MDGPWNETQRAELEQELLELHFGCHPEPERMLARLEREPELRQLQQRVLATASLLRVAAQPAQPPLPLPAVPARPPFWRRPRARLSSFAAAAMLLVGTLAAVYGVHVGSLAKARREECRVTVSAPRAVPAGAPWSFTVEAEDLDGRPQTCDLSWRVLAADGRELGAGAGSINGRGSIAMMAGMAVPERLLVKAVHVHGVFEQALAFQPGATAPLVHVTTDRPIYRPGEAVFVRAVALDRCTLQPAAVAKRLRVTIKDARGGLAFTQNVGEAKLPGGGAGGSDVGSGVATAVWRVPEESAGGTHTVEVTAWDGTLPAEVQTIVVRPFVAPRLQKSIALDRTTYAPGQHGSAEVAVTRLGGEVAVGAAVRAALVLDGDEVWSATGTLDARGKATFGFAVPASVRQGAARLLATITDGGVVETELEAFVVPTGEVLASAFPEGGELIAGVENRVYVELLDPLGRPVDGVGVVEDSRGERVAEFATVHQGRARCAFMPQVGVDYWLRVQGMKAPLPLAAVRERGIALRPSADALPGTEHVRLQLAGRGEGPWLVGVFCRGVLVGQATVRPDARGEVATAVDVPVPATAAGVLRVTVFDRELQPVAERLVQRLTTQRLDLTVQAAHESVAPGDNQQLTMRAADENGRPVAGAVLGLCVTDGATLAMASEPRIGLLDQWLLFADCERVENLGALLPGSTDAARNVDLLLGTRGWRRFVWRNDEAAKAALADAGDWGAQQLEREGFAQHPQVLDNGEAARAAVAADQQAVSDSSDRLAIGIWAGFALLTLGVALELIAWLLQRTRAVQVIGFAATAAAGLWLLVVFVQSSPLRARLEVADGAVAWAEGGEVAVFAKAPVPVAGGVVADLFADEAGKPGEPGLFFNDGAEGHVMHLGARARRGLVGPSVVAGPGAPGGGLLGPAAAGPAGPPAPLPIVREYAHRRVSGARRTDFTDTICWQPLLVTDAQGNATTTFDTSDAVTTWHVHVDAHGGARIGTATATFIARLPFHAEAKLPAEVSAGDQLLLPVAIESTNGATTATVEATPTGALAMQGPTVREVPLIAGRGRVMLPITVHDDAGSGALRIQSRSGRFQDDVGRTIAVAPRGFPQVRSWGGRVAQGQPVDVAVALPNESVRGSGRLSLRVFPSPLAGIAQGLQGLLQEPNGCFEQASSSNYPNVMVLGYIEASGDDVPALAARARELLPRGYQRITGYECKERGYEWFGGDPGHEALTAYGLLQFHDMRRVYAVDVGMIERTKAWLLGRRDGKGGYRRNDRALDSFGRAPQAITDAYVTCALLEAGTTPAELRAEIDALVARTTATEDAYELALVARALGTCRHDAAAGARQRLQQMQREDGSLRGTTKSITSSGGEDLAVETTAWATLAWLHDDACTGSARRAADWLQQRRQANGRFGATQATICALRALTAWAQQARTMQAGGTLTVLAGEKELGRATFTKGQGEAIEFELWGKLPPGEHPLRLQLESEAEVELPWACDLAYHAELPADDPQAPIALATRLVAARVEEGRMVALEVALQNRSDEGQPMTLAIVGLPAGLEVPTRVLDDLKHANAFDLWELRGRELVLYWRSLAARAEHRVAIDCLAAIPGTTMGPASRAYLYYTPAQKRWATPLRVEVTAK